MMGFYLNAENIVMRFGMKYSRKGFIGSNPTGAFLNNSNKYSNLLHVISTSGMRGKFHGGSGPLSSFLPFFLHHTRSRECTLDALLGGGGVKVAGELKALASSAKGEKGRGLVRVRPYARFFFC